MNNYAPIALFAYKRLDHLKNTLNSLKKNNEAKKSILYIFSDNWKSEKDKLNILKVREYIKNISGFKKKIVIFRKNNFGLSKNIICGVSEILKRNQKIIVLEDDLIVSKFFLSYMNQGLKIYENNNSVASIHGYVYPLSNYQSITKTFFIKGADCWGWATWKRAWKKFDSNSKRLIKKIRKKSLIKEFNFNNTYDYFEMLNKQARKKNDSWAIRWYASAFLNNMYTLYPRKTFVINAGLDGSGTNIKNIYHNFQSKLDQIPIGKIKKILVNENFFARRQFEFFFLSLKLSLVEKFFKLFNYFIRKYLR